MSKQNYRYTIYDNNKHAVIGEFNDGGTAQAKKIVAQHYQYLRCARNDYFKMFDVIGSSRSKVAKWLLRHAASNRLGTKNMVYGSQRSIAKEIHVSYTTVKKVIKKMVNYKMAITGTDIIIISPMVIFYGDDDQFLYNLRRFNELSSRKYKGTHSSSLKAIIKNAKGNDNKRMYNREVNRDKQDNKRDKVRKEKKYIKLLQYKAECNKKRILRSKRDLLKLENKKDKQKFDQKRDLNPNRY